MLGLFQKPVVELKLKNPNWICGRHLTLVDVSITGSCRVIIYSDTHPDWKPIKIKPKQVMSGVIVAPIGAKLTIQTRKLLGKTDSYFEVPNTNWSISTPEIPEIELGTVVPPKSAIQAWRSFVKRLEKTKPLQSTSLLKIKMKSKFISMRVSKKMFNHREEISNDRSVHLQSE